MKGYHFQNIVQGLNNPLVQYMLPLHLKLACSALRCLSLFAQPASSKPEPSLLQPILRNRRHVLRRQLVHLLLTRDDVNLINRNRPARAEPGLVSEVQHQEDGDGDVGGQEVAHVPVVPDEDLEPVGQGQQEEEAHHEVGGIGLEPRAVGELLKHVVKDHGLAEAEVGDEDDDPGNVPGDGGDVHEPPEHGGA